MIFYFSGTGNSRFVAERIAERVSDDLVSLNELFRNGAKREYFSEKPFVFVAPIYAAMLPKVVTEFIKRVNLTGSNKIYFVTTLGDKSSGALKSLEKLAKFKNMELQGFEDIQMPNNYLLLSNVKTFEDSIEDIESSLDLIDEVAQKIATEEKFRSVKETSIVAKAMSNKAYNNGFYKFMAKDDGFFINEDCIRCGVCEKLCPLKNITLEFDTPQWNGRCTHCVACISGCPSRAIEFKNKTQNRNRYFLPFGFKI